MKTGNQDLIKAINKVAILKEIKNTGLISRSEIASCVGLSPAAVTGLTADLINAGYLLENKLGDSSGGRPPILLSINPAGGYAIGIKLTETELISTLTNLNAESIDKQTIKLDTQDQDRVLSSMVALVNDLILRNSVDRDKVLGVGIGLAGVVDYEKGILRQSPFLDWENLFIRDELEDQLKVSVLLDNDVNTLTLDEKWFGSGQDVDHFSVITVGRGIGLGSVINGQINRGAKGGAGEFGHMMIVPKGLECSCGKKGCVEAYASYPGLIAMSKTAFIKSGIDLEEFEISDLLAYAEQGHEIVLEVFRNAGEKLGIGIANLINLTNPSKIIISGEGLEVGEYMVPAVQIAIENNVMPPLLDDVEIIIKPLGDDSWARGAASLVLHEFFQHPIFLKERV